MLLVRRSTENRSGTSELSPCPAPRPTPGWLPCCWCDAEQFVERFGEAGRIAVDDREDLDLGFARQLVELFDQGFDQIHRFRRAAHDERVGPRVGLHLHVGQNAAAEQPAPFRIDRGEREHRRTNLILAILRAGSTAALHPPPPVCGLSPRIAS